MKEAALFLKNSIKMNFGGNMVGFLKLG